MEELVNDTFLKLLPIFDIDTGLTSIGDSDNNTEIQKYRQCRYD